MVYNKREGVPQFESFEIAKKKNKYVLLIPIINEKEHITNELKRAKKKQIDQIIDIVICDGGSTDGGTDIPKLKKLGVNTLLVKQDSGKQGAQLRMGFFWAFERGYQGIITIDGNDKDSIEDVPSFIKKIDEGYDFVQGSRFIKGGHEINTPFIRKIALRCLHAPIISLTAHKWYTDTTNNYRAYSIKYLQDDRVNPLREIFVTYELLAYLSVRADQLNMKTCEIPVTRAYPKSGKTRTKISFFKGNSELFKILILNLFHKYNVKGDK